MTTDSLLATLWKQQIVYNQRVRALERSDNYEYWMKQYLLGMVAEVDEVLQEINWKIHRRGHLMNKDNVARELADMTKYVMCLWEWSGFTLADMLAYVAEKNQELEMQWEQDFLVSFEPEDPVVIVDLDGTIANWRIAFYKWIVNNHLDRIRPYLNGELLQDPATTLAMDVDLNIPYDEYVDLKEAFEAAGQYEKISPYEDGIQTIRELTEKGVVVLVYTARPVKRHSRIWIDTWHWFEKLGISTCVSELRVGVEDRIVRAKLLEKHGNPVVLLEDDPGLALRAANAGLTVFLRSHPYNIGIHHANIHRIITFSAKEILEKLT